MTNKDDNSQKRRESLFSLARQTRGFMPDDEGEALFSFAKAACNDSSGASTLVEIGAWCGKSTIYLGAAAEETKSVLFSIDHHRGSEENQVGWEHHDADLVNQIDGRIDTLPHWRRSIANATLEKTVVGLVGESPTIGAHWSQALTFCFIDGGHGEEPAWADFRTWSPFVRPGGYLAIHDVFPDPSMGGRPPYEIYCAALEAGFKEIGAQGSLRVVEASKNTNE